MLMQYCYLISWRERGRKGGDDKPQINFNDQRVRAADLLARDAPRSLSACMQKKSAR